MAKVPSGQTIASYQSSLADKLNNSDNGLDKATNQAILSKTNNDKTIKQLKEKIELEQKSLDKLKEESKKLNNRDNSSMYLTSSLGFRVNADPKSIDNLDSLISIGDEITQFMDYDNELHELSLDDLKVIKLEIQKNGCNLYKQKWAMKSRILNAKSLDELNFEIKFEMLDFRN